MTIRRLVPLCLLLLAFGAAAQENRGDDKTQPPASYVPTGKAIFKLYCSACHGADAKGHGPATARLNTRVPDLTTLTKRRGGKFPFEYVESTIRFGPGLNAHGSQEMPVWGPIFQYLENYNEGAVRQRIWNLCEYLESLQQR